MDNIVTPQVLRSNGQIVRTLQIGEYVVNLHHSIETVELDTKGQENENKPIVINNHMPIANSNQLTKIVQIVLKNRIITVKEVFIIRSKDVVSPKPRGQQESQEIQKIQLGESSPSHKNFDPSLRKNVEIMKRPAHVPLLFNNERRDTKNIVRNVLKMFEKWSTDNKKKIEQQDQKFSYFLKDFINGVHFNNTVIYQLANNQNLAVMFQKFLETEFEGYLKKSRILDKKSHLEARDRYIQILRQAQVDQEKEQLREE